jgi:hypothetical protein
MEIMGSQQNIIERGLTYGTKGLCTPRYAAKWFKEKRKVDVSLYNVNPPKLLYRAIGMFYCELEQQFAI